MTIIGRVNIIRTRYDVLTSSTTFIRSLSMCAHITNNIDSDRNRIVNMAHTRNLDIDTNIDMTAIVTITITITHTRIVTRTLTLNNNITFTLTHIHMPIFIP